MPQTIALNNQKQIFPKGIICPEDEQEKEFAALLKLWLSDQISYEKLVENMPDQYQSKWRLLLKKVLRLSA
ncbi:MAG: hypothetical protein AABZ54_02930 [Bacteroidota bacterium]